MKPLFKSTLIFMMVIAVLSCNQDPCDVAHTIINGECMPDYIFPPNPNLQFGDRFYHPEYGVVVFKNGDWYDDQDELLEELTTKRN